MKILQISDVHLDLSYTIGSDAGHSGVNAKKIFIQIILLVETIKIFATELLSYLLALSLKNDLWYNMKYKDALVDQQIGDKTSSKIMNCWLTYSWLSST